MASSSSFQVFLSFRGEDTRFGFTGHLNAALKQRGINTYIDDRLGKGEEISEALLTAIEESTVSIIVLSKDYASSSWCLDELSKILECKKTMEQKVVPVFYQVEPSDVRHIRGSFAKGFEKQQQRFKDNIDKVERWKAALVEVTSLSGFHLRGDSLEAKFVEEIVDVVDSSLLTFPNDMIKMHDLLRHMTLNIRQEPNEPSNLRRLCTPEDICHVLTKDIESIEEMELDVSKISRRVFISPAAFARMCNLRFLKFYYSDSEKETKLLLKKSLESLPDILSYLHWDEYPSKSLPSTFCPKNLVELCMPNSHVERLWNGVQNLVKLEKLDLSHSKYLINIPDLSQATNLKDLMLNGCSNIRRFPEIPKNLEKLSLSETAIEEVPSSIGDLSTLKYLYLRDCEWLERLPSSICKLKFLEILDLSGCFKLESFPEILETMESIIKLDLSFTSIEELPLSIVNLVWLTHLDLRVCDKLKNLPQVLPPHLEFLDAHECRSLKEISSALPISLEKKQRFMFTQCLNLHQNCINWVKTPLSIQQRATEDVKLYHEKVKLDHEEPNLRSSLSIYFRGSKIPEWFSSKRQGSSVTIKLPPHWHDDKFLGFVVCAVLYKGVQFEDFNVSCRCNFKSNDDFEYSLEFPLWDESDGPRFIGGDNVVLGYDFDCYRAWYKEKSEHHLIEASFDLSDLRKVKECGVCLLYAQDEVMPDDQEEQKHPD